MSLEEFFLSSRASLAYIETLEIAHPNFTATHWVNRNVSGSLVLTLETGADQAFAYTPCKIVRKRQSGNLDQGFAISFGDVGSILNVELAAVAAADGFGTRPTVRYRVWRSDQLYQPMYGPIELQIQRVSVSRQGATFDVVAPRLNVTATGELYTVERFEMLRAVL